MANKQIIEFGIKEAPEIGDHLLLQDNVSGVYLQTTRGNLIRRQESLQFVIGDGSGIPDLGVVGLIYLPQNCRVEISGWRLGSMDGSSGTIQIDLWHDQNRVSVSNADSICGSGNEPVLSSQSENSSQDLSGWVCTMVEGGCLVANLDSIVSLTQVVLALDVEITPME